MSNSFTPRVRLELEALESRYVLSSSSFVGALYGDLLHRSASAPEVAGFVNQLNSGASANQVALAFTTSSEFLGNLVQSDYQIFLKRPASSQEVQAWVGQLQNGLGEQQLQATIIGSDEFFALHGSDNNRYVGAVYKAVLGRPAGASEVAQWAGQLNAGASRSMVALSIVTSTESEGRLVTAAYQEVLGRAPDPAGLSGFVGALQAGQTPSQLLADLAGSQEFINDQGGLDVVVNPNPVFVPVFVPVPVDTFIEPGLGPFGFGGFGGFGGFSGFSGCGCSGTGFGGSGFGGSGAGFSGSGSGF